MKPRLNSVGLDHLPAGASVPQYDRSNTGAGMVHLGVGAFHRAHQAWYTEQALNGVGGNWAIIGASLRSAGVRDQLNPQDGLYTLVVRDGDEERHQVIGAIKRVLVAPENPSALVALMAHPDIRVISLTVTEKGYLYNPASKELQLNHPDVQKDIHGFPHNPVTALGFLAAALAARRQAAAGGVTILSCDNLPHNGRVLHRVLSDFVRRVDPSLFEWMEGQVTFPSTMVDRIVPATTADDLSELEKSLGCEDRAAVFTEPFSQWVIENNFANGAPDWRSAGAIYTDDVTPFENMKLRLLNGSHSLMAYLGYLAGFDYVHQVMADNDFQALVHRFMDCQAQPTLQVPDSFDIDQYKDQLCQRFANSALNHRLYQVAQDGSQKLPQRWLSPLLELLEKKQGADILAFALAGWIRYQSGLRDSGERFDVDDPLSSVLQAAATQSDPVMAVFSIAEVFGDFARRYPDYVDIVRNYYRQILALGVKQVVKDVASGHP